MDKVAVAYGAAAERGGGESIVRIEYAKRRPWIVRLWREITGQAAAERKCRELAMRIGHLKAESRGWVR
jgi:hypothetical protein